MTSALPSEALRARLTGEQRGLLADYWWRRAEGEITSWVGFGHVLSDLRVEGSPPAVIALAERASRGCQRVAPLELAAQAARPRAVELHAHAEPRLHDGDEGDGPPPGSVEIDPDAPAPLVPQRRHLRH